MIDAEYFWKIIIILAILTLLIRFSIIAISSKVIISDRFKEIFSYIPAAILPSIIAPMVFFHKGQVGWAYGKERLLILVLATVVCYYSKTMIATILFGLVALFLISQ